MRIILFLFCFIPHLYSMDSPDVLKAANILAKISNKNSLEKLRKKSQKKLLHKKKFYSIKCFNFKIKCKQKFISKSETSLTRSLLRHLFSEEHDPVLYNRFFTYVSKNARKIDGKWSIKSLKYDRKLTASTIYLLTKALISHEFATRKKNSEIYDEMKEYIKDNAKIIYR